MSILPWAIDRCIDWFQYGLARRSRDAPILASWQVKQKNFAAIGAGAHIELRHVLHLRAIAGAQFFAVHGHRAAHDLHPCLAATGQGMRNRLAPVHGGGKNFSVLMDGDRAIASIARCDEPQPPPLVVVAETLLLVARRQ